MWVQFKQRWQDGLYKYQIGMKVEIPNVLALGYIQSGKAKPCKPPEHIVSSVKEDKVEKEKYPSARRRIKKISSMPQNSMSIRDYADQAFDD